MSPYFIGLMSGTSADGIDAALVKIEGGLQLLHHHCEPIPEALRSEILSLATPGDNEIDRLGKLDCELGSVFAQAARQLLTASGIAASDITAIGSHGQTIRHRPPAGANDAPGFTLQIADPNTIALKTGITTVADFRRRDLAAGGQGAPLAPVFHQFIAPSDCETVGFLNLGGIANITLLHRGKLAFGFDTGPANGLMDAWINRQHGKPYDDNGEWASSGSCNEQLLAQLLKDEYLAAAPPKSTGKEYFNLAWLDQQLARFGGSIDNADVQATLLQLTVHSIALALEPLTLAPERIYYCGGGANNAALIAALAQHTPQADWYSTSELGVHPDWIEACAFAWFAHQSLHREALPLAQYSGAARNAIAGGVYYAD